MKKVQRNWIAVLIAVFSLSGAGWGQPRAARPLAAVGTVQAQRLEAQMLAENLLDFAQRSGSARAYLMAAELLLLYPPGEQRPDLEGVRGLLATARRLEPSEPSIRAWAGQLEARLP